MRSVSNSLVVAVIALLALAAVAQPLISLSHALLPVLIVGAVAAVVLRLVFFHARRF